MFALFLILYPIVNNLAAPIFMNVDEVKSFAYGVDFSLATDGRPEQNH